MHRRVFAFAFLVSAFFSQGLTLFSPGLNGQMSPSALSADIRREAMSWIAPRPGPELGLLGRSASNQEVGNAEGSGTNRLKAALVGAGVGGVLGGVIVWDLLEIESDPDDDLSETYYLVEGVTFWKAVGIGAAVGATAGAIIGGVAFGPYGSGPRDRNTKVAAVPLVGPRGIGASVRVAVR